MDMNSMSIIENFGLGSPRTRANNLGLAG